MVEIDLNDIIEEIFVIGMALITKSELFTHITKKEIISLERNIDDYQEDVYY